NEQLSAPRQQLEALLRKRSELAADVEGPLARARERRRVENDEVETLATLARKLEEIPNVALPEHVLRALEPIQLKVLLAPVEERPTDVDAHDLTGLAQPRDDAEGARVRKKIEHACVPRRRGDFLSVLALIEEEPGRLPAVGPKN